MGRWQVLAIAILGAWIMSTLCMWFAATRSFATVERVLKRAEPQFLETTKPLGEASTRVVLRYMASEINRTLFWGYGALQIGLGAVLFLLLLRQTPRNAVDVGVVATMLALSVILTLVITPLSLPRLDGASIFFRAIPLRRSCRASGRCTGRSPDWMASSSSRVSAC